MPSRFLDADQVRRQSELRFNFGNRTLAGRSVLVTGGVGGLGAAVVALLLQEGALPVVGYRTNRGKALAFQQKMQDLYGGVITLVEGDISNADARRQYMQSAQNITGELYGLVEATGDPARVKPDALDGAALHASFSANCEGPILLARAFAQGLAAHQTQGAIVLLSSMQGVHAFEGSLAYAVPKAALVHGARILAKEFGGAQNIRVNVVAPGATSAGMARASIESGKYDPYVDRGVIPRFGRPEDIARAVRFLLEPDSYVTGQVLTIDGGLTLRRDRINS
jgi:pteridine reductase